MTIGRLIKLLSAVNPELEVRLKIPSIEHAGDILVPLVFDDSREDMEVLTSSRDKDGFGYEAREAKIVN